MVSTEASSFRCNSSWMPDLKNHQPLLFKWHICFNHYFHRDQFYLCMPSSCAKLGPYNKGCLIIVKHLTNVVCVVFHRGPRQKTESSSHRWCSDFTMEYFFSSCSYMLHIQRSWGAWGEQKSPIGNYPLQGIN